MADFIPFHEVDRGILVWDVYTQGLRSAIYTEPGLHTGLFARILKCGPAYRVRVKLKPQPEFSLLKEMRKPSFRNIPISWGGA